MRESSSENEKDEERLFVANKKAEFPFCLPPHYRVLSKSSQKFALDQIGKNSDDSEKCKSDIGSHRDFLLAMGMLICVDIILWYGVKKIFYKNPKNGQYASFWQSKPYQNSHRQSARASKKFHIPSPSSSFRQNMTSTSMRVPPVVAHHMKVLNINHVTDRLPTRLEIKDAYRRVCLQTHPDTFGPDMPESERKRCEQRFIDATRSYEVLFTLTSPMTDR